MDNIKPIYDPLLFGDEKNYQPIFDPYHMQFNASLVITVDEVVVNLNKNFISLKLFKKKY